MRAAEKPIKLLLLGDAGVGKTNLTYTYINKNYPIDTTSTIGVDYSATYEDISQFFPSGAEPSASAPQTLTARWRRLWGKETITTASSQINSPEDVKRICLQIWDTGGQERFRSIVTTYYRNCDGVVLVCDLTRRETMSSLNRWLQEFDMHAVNPWRETPRVVIGNKSDLVAPANRNHITPAELAEFAESIAAPCFITTCRGPTGGSIESVREPFLTVAAEAFKERQRHPPKLLPPPARLESDRMTATRGYSKCCPALKR